jgi:hypothetical protein
MKLAYRLRRPTVSGDSPGLWDDDARKGCTRAALAALTEIVVAMIGAVLGFWTQPWGTNVGATRETGIAAVGGPIVIAGSLLMAIGLVAFARASARSRLLPAWLSIVTVGALSVVPWLHEATLQGALFGVAWGWSA